MSRYILSMDDATQTAVLVERIARLLQNLGNADDLNPVQWEALRYFDRANKFSCTPSGLTDYLGVTKGTVSQTINAIERKGLVTKADVPGNARSVRIQLTEEGKRQLAKNPLRTLIEDLDELDGADLRRLKESLRHIVEKSLRRREGSAFGICISCNYFESMHEEGSPHRCGLLELPLAESDATLICREYTA